jgi:hypothetical protein
LLGGVHRVQFVLLTSMYLLTCFHQRPAFSHGCWPTWLL